MKTLRILPKFLPPTTSSQIFPPDETSSPNTLNYIIAVGTLWTRLDLPAIISDNFNFHVFSDIFTSGSWIWSRLPPKSATIKS